MSKERPAELLQFLGRLCRHNSSAVSDGQLLERFACQRDGAAFELLLWRHGTMVLNVCRRILHHEADVEDAFQASFLALVRKAGSIGRREVVAGWLYRVAFRVALAAKARREKLACRERPAVMESAAAAEPAWNDLRPMLDEELNRLPERYRLPIVLCYLEGLSNKEAARQLGCATGTIFSRLARGRQLLRARLLRRGLALSIGFFTTLSTRAETASLASTLVSRALNSAVLSSAGKTAAIGVSIDVASLAEGVLRAMLLSHLKKTAGVLMAVVLLIAGSVLGYRALTATEAKEPSNQPARAAQAVPAKDALPVVVQVAKPRQGSIQRQMTQPAVVTSFDHVELFPQVSGILWKQKVDIGNRVKKGEVLAEIDSPILANEEEQAAIAVELARTWVLSSRAALESAQAEADAAKERIKQSEAETAAARAQFGFQKAQFDRFKRLEESKAIDTSVLDEAREKLRSAEARAAAAQAGIQTAKIDLRSRTALVDKARADLQTREAGVKAAQASLNKARIMMELTRVVAPFDGIVTARNLNNGAHVRGDGPHRPLFAIHRTDLMRVVVQVPENVIAHIEPGARVELTVAGAKTLSGYKIARVGYAVDEKTGTMRVEIDVPNSLNLFRPGMHAQTILHVKGSPDALTLPLSCLVETKAGLAVYVLRDGTAQRTQVQVGWREAGRTEVVAGVTANDLVVLNPKGIKGETAPVKVENP